MEGAEIEKFFSFKIFVRRVPKRALDRDDISCHYWYMHEGKQVFKSSIAVYKPIDLTLQGEVSWLTKIRNVIATYRYFRFPEKIVICSPNFLLPLKDGPHVLVLYMRVLVPADKTRELIVTYSDEHLRYQKRRPSANKQHNWLMRKARLKQSLEAATGQLLVEYFDHHADIFKVDEDIEEYPEPADIKNLVLPDDSDESDNDE